MNMFKHPLPWLILAGFAAAAPFAAAQSQAPASGMMVPIGGTHAAKLPPTDRFKTAAAALAHCPGGTVVWSTLSKSKVYHLSGSRYYGTTKHGAYLCKSDALTYGFHQAKS